MERPDDLFASARSDALAKRAPLAERLRPTRLDDVVGQSALLGPDGVLRRLVEADRLSSVILWGPAGTGKTTIARLVARTTASAFEPLSAVSASVADVRGVLTRARERLGERDQATILFLDEVHRFSKSQQDVLLPAVESGLVILIGATTENPHFEVNAPLLSRSTLFRLQPLDDAALGTLLDRGADAEDVTVDPEAAAHLVQRVEGDGRRLLTALEVAAALVRERGASEGAVPTVGLDDVEAALGVHSVRYGRDAHYDVISAFIKSIRGGDPDAGLYWLATMLEAGEDARFIARRLVILASEDVGMADSNGLVVANAAAQAIEFVGLPEAQLNLAHAVVYLACAPKSNTTTVGIGRARADVRNGVTGEVPVHLRDAHYSGAASLGHGVGYDYPHDDPRGWVDQTYLPDVVAGRTYYEPSAHGAEAEVGEKLARRRNNPE